MKKRLQSVARYESFHPQALACSVPLQDVEYTTDSNTFLNSDRHSPSTSPQRWRRFASLPESPRIARPQTSASLGAVAGSDGVAIFRISQPQMPLMILSHASTSFTTTEASPAITSLAFSTGASRSSLYLASARGSGALIWDVSGHSLSPLQGRLGVEDSSDHSSITSLAWIKKGTRLAATTAASACIWDLRDSHSYRPSLRFGITNTSGQHGTIFPDIPSYRQITCSDQAEECAVLDSAGTVRIFDTRMTDRVTRRSMGSLCQFDAFDFAGVGLCFLPTTQGDGKSWVTWGLDAPNSNAVVKVWMKSADNVSPVKEDSTPDNYWYLDTSPARQKSRKTFLSTKNESTSYCLVGKCTTSNLACARVCPEPVEDAIVTVGLQNGTGASWQAELWALRVNVATDDDSVKESKLERIISFQSSNGADECLDAVGGSDPSMFNLRASELAVSSYSGSFSKTNNYGLLLCCLTDNGYVITHAIPEALPGASQFQPDTNGHVQPNSNVSTLPMKFFPAESESAIEDAAKWSSSINLNVAAFRRDVSIGTTTTTTTTGISSLIHADGTEMPFDMDLPLYPLSSLGISSRMNQGLVGDLISPTTLSTAASMDENDQTETNRLSSLVMDSIDTARIPCPRICGATFSAGVGGLAAFHNGDVKKMWGWWVQKDPLRSTAAPGVIVQPSHIEVSTDFQGIIGDGLSVTVLSSTDHARTLKDLLNMTSAAKSAQWGEHDDLEASSLAFPVLGANFFDDDSEGMSESDENDDDDLVDSTGLKTGQMHENYFNDNQHSLFAQDDQSEENLVHGNKYDGLHADINPTTMASGILTPLVQVSRKYNLLAFNNQCAELALTLKLRSFKSLDEKECVPSNESHKVSSSLSNRTNSKRDKVDVVVSSGIQSKRVLPSYRSLLPAARESSNPPHALKTHKQDERGVHGGEYSVRPNMHESMVFLRKLFIHQNQDENKAAFQSLLSPPDNPMMIPKTSNMDYGYVQDSTAKPSLCENSIEHAHAGVQTITPDVVLYFDEEIKEIEGICLHNAEVCRSRNEGQKMDAWHLVATVVRSRAHSTGNGFDGWRGSNGGAMGELLLENLLRYFESLGDVQMLSSLVCTLRRNDSRKTVGKRRFMSLLPANQDARYDRYIRRYADLVFGWRLLTLRAELTKHLARSIAVVEALGRDVSAGLDESTSVSLEFTCPRCHERSERGYCQFCNNYAFQCVICDVAVRGLFTSCDSCGHGGHVNHMSEWFALQNMECPSGCGCKCRLVAMIPGEFDPMLGIMTKRLASM